MRPCAERDRVVGGTAGYVVLGRWGLLDALYMTMTTISIVGYGEVRDPDTSGRLWSIALMITGASVLVYATSSSEMTMWARITSRWTRVTAIR